MFQCRQTYKAKAGFAHIADRRACSDDRTDLRHSYGYCPDKNKALS